MKNIGEPIDWHYWRNMQEVELWQACLLSLNTNPDTMQINRNGWMGEYRDAPYFEQESFPSDRARDDYRKRLSLLRSNIFKREYFNPGKLDMGSPSCSGVQLAEFAAWAMQIELSIPPELTAIARSPATSLPKAAMVEEKPLASRERNTLLSMIAALCKEANLDYTKPSKTAGLIQRTAEQMGLSIGETTIEEHLKKIPDALATRTK